MIQFNLLPDVKIEYLKARRTKRLVMLAASIIAGGSLVIMIALFVGVNILQKNHMKNLRADIDSMSRQLQSEPEINKILTVQNQLGSLNSLHENKPAAERLGDYLPQLVPTDTTVSSLNIDFEARTMTFNGSGKSLKAVNQFVDTLKFTKYKTDDQTANAFSQVVLASFSLSDQADNDWPATYQITLAYDPVIFTSTQKPQLEVPKTVTTRSSTEKPDQDIFMQDNSEGEAR